MKIKLIFTFVLLTACFGNKADKISKKPLHTLCENINEMKICPTNKGSIILPRTYPARSIYLGFANDDIHFEFLKSIVSLVKSMPTRPMINILIPRTEDASAYAKLRKYFNHSEYRFLNFIPTSSNETIWAQDYMEILLDTQTGLSKIIDLPYSGREGEAIPTSIALSCQKELIEQDVFKAENMPGNGDYGGNIEAITTELVMVGNNLSNETYNILQKATNQDLVDVDVLWLETGHVDELITTFPHHKNAKACDQSLLVASPQLGLDIIKNAPATQIVEKNEFLTYFDDYDNWPDHYHCIYVQNSKKNECIELYRANESYQVSIDKSISLIQKKMQKHHRCKLPVKKFPQLFLPLKTQKIYGLYTDRAIALNPNSVNNIFFYPHLILPRQLYAPFQKEVEKVLEDFPYNIVFANGKFVHELNGGVHCATNVSYGCSPQ